MGSTTITERLDAPPGTRAFQRAYDAALGRSGLLLDQARGKARQLTPIELAGVAGAWARRASLPVSGDSIGPEAVAAVLEALTALGVALPLPVPPDWRPAPESLDPGLLQQQLATEQLGWVALAVSVKYGPPGYVLDGQLSHREAAEWLARTVRCLRAGIEHWALEASRQLQAVGVLVDPLQRQLVAARIVRLGLVPKAEQVRAYESGELPSPLPEYPPPPSPLKQTSGPTLQEALDVWAQRRRPAPKTIHDAQGRLRDLIDWLGTDQLEELTAEKANGWVQELLHSNLSVQSVTRRVALVKATLSAARAGGMLIRPEVIEALSGRGLRPEKGTTANRRAFTLEEARILWEISRQQNRPAQRPLDRWGFPLSLATGLRLEEIAGLRREDLMDVDGIKTLRIRPHEDRRLKNEASQRHVPMPAALVQEGFVDWAHGQTGELLFPEPNPPPADPRLSHYASVRLGKILRKEAGVTDRTVVFHSCRHFTCQQLVDAGVEQRLIEALVGHASRSMTARYSRQGPPLRLLAEAQEKRDWGWVSAGGNSHFR